MLYLVSKENKILYAMTFCQTMLCWLYSNIYQIYDLCDNVNIYNPLVNSNIYTYTLCLVN